MNDKTYRKTKKSKTGEFSLKVKAQINDDIELICRIKNAEKTAFCNKLLEKAVAEELERIRKSINE